MKKKSIKCGHCGFETTTDFKSCQKCGEIIPRGTFTPPSTLKLDPDEIILEYLRIRPLTNKYVEFIAVLYYFLSFAAFLSYLNWGLYVLSNFSISIFFTFLRVSIVLLIFLSLWPLSIMYLRSQHFILTNKGVFGQTGVFFKAKGYARWDQISDIRMETDFYTRGQGADKQTHFVENIYFYSHYLPEPIVFKNLPKGSSSSSIFDFAQLLHQRFMVQLKQEDIPDQREGSKSDTIDELHLDIAANGIQVELRRTETLSQKQ